MANETVLLVDDDEDLLRLLLLALKNRANYDVHLASSGLGAVEKIKHISPAIIILDMMMPDLNGIDVCRYIRSQAALRSTPVAMLTALDDATAHAAALEAGATAIWLKPIKPSELIARIGELLTRSI